jgi:hypothetical protein
MFLISTGEDIHVPKEGEKMALVRCPGCRKQVSDRAFRCPECAHPLAGGGSTQASDGKIQTIEPTSKKYKLQKLLCLMLVIISLVSVIGHIGLRANPVILITLGVLAFIFGLIWYIGFELLVWWRQR